jgi:uncharacterized protein
MNSSYAAPLWLPGGHAQTIYASLSRWRALPQRPCEFWTAPDGDQIEVDRVDGPAGAPLLVFFHGLEGGRRSHYSRALFDACAAKGWRMLLPHFRGCGRSPNELPRAYHSGDSAEADWILRRAQAEAGAAPMYAAGISLGGNVLLKWLGEQGEAAAAVLRAAVAVSAPVDLHAAGNALGRGFNMVYTRMFLATLIAKSLAMLERHPGLFDADRVRAARSLREFDDLVTAPLHGFVDAADYWTQSSAKPLLRGIQVPTLLLNARNDPFLPEEALPAADDVSAAVALEYPAQGGHVGFVAGAFPGHFNWLPARIIDFLSQARPSTESS